MTKVLIKLFQIYLSINRKLFKQKQRIQIDQMVQKFRLEQKTIDRARELIKKGKMPEARTLIHDSHNPRSIRNALGKELYEGSLRRIREFDKGNRD